MRLICLVDNGVRPSSDFWGEHGLAFLVLISGLESTGGGSREGWILFDTGASGEVLLHNMDAASVAPEQISALALSHSHPDHTGGLEALLERRPGLPVYAHPGLLRERFSQHAGRMEARGLPMGADRLRQQADLRLSPDPQEIVPGVWTTGEIRERPEAEGRSSRHFVRRGERWAPDPYRDDMSLVLEGPQGLVLVCGCCHAGLLNTLLSVRRVFGRHPVAVAGGAHLANADADHLGRLLEALRALGPPDLYLNHCTGDQARLALAQAFGDQVAACPAGTVLEFQGGESSNGERTQPITELLSQSS